MIILGRKYEFQNESKLLERILKILVKRNYLSTRKIFEMHRKIRKKYKINFKNLTILNASKKTLDAL